MRTLANLKLSNTIRNNIINFCEAYLAASSENPTVGIVSSALGIPDVGYDLNEEVSDVFIRKCTVLLAEAVLDAPAREVTRDVRDREGRERDVARGFEGYTELDPAMQRMVSGGSSPESLGVDFDTFMDKVTPDELQHYIDTIKNQPDLTNKQLELLNYAGVQQQTPTSSAPTAPPEAPPAAPPTPKLPPAVPTAPPEAPPAAPPEIEPDEEKKPRTIPQEIPQQKPEVEPVQPKPYTKPQTETETETKPQTETETETETKTRVRRAIDLKLRTSVAPATEDETKSLVEPTGKIKSKTGKKPAEKEGFGTDIPAAFGRGVDTGKEKGEPKSTPKTADTSKSTPIEPFKSDLGDVRYAALVARGAPGEGPGRSVVLPVYEERKNNQKHQYRVVITEENEQKVEIFARSIPGIKQAVYGKQNYQVFDPKGSNITSYFERMQKKGK